MLTEKLSLDEATLKEITGGGTIEFYNYTPRSKTGVRGWEIKVRNQDGGRKIVVVRDYGFNISKKVIKVNHFQTRAERNAEIYRLYSKEDLSQVFLANFFNISQPSISLIIKAGGKK